VDSRSELIAGAERAVTQSSARADVSVHLATEPADLHVVRSICDAVWPSVSGGTQLQPNLLKAIVYSGGYASIATSSGEPVGAAVAVSGRHRRAQGGWVEVLHSHMAAVLDGVRDRGVGTALKQHQRMWALQQDLPVIAWTFDPLVRRNAVFNIRNLGVQVAKYEVNFYGPMDDALNHGDETDRLLAWWQLDAPTATSAALQPLPALVTPPKDSVTIEIPADIVRLRQQDPSAAQRWRIQVREAFQSAFAQGWQVIGVDATGNYVVAPVAP
jgi:predicted GNAT superfamily acetyltransferase